MKPSNSGYVMLIVSRAAVEQLYETSKKVFGNPLYQITDAQQELRDAMADALGEDEDE